MASDEIEDERPEQVGTGGGDMPRTPSTLPLRRHLSDIATDLWRPRPTREAVPTSRRPASRDVVNGLERREVYLGAGLAVLDALITVTGYLHLHGSSNATYRSEATSFLVSGLIGALLMGVGAAMRRRALLGFASFLVGLEFLTYRFIYGVIVYLLFGGWLLYRVMQKQKQDRLAAPPRPRATTAPSARTPATPRASKRYTPPKRSTQRRGAAR